MTRIDFQTDPQQYKHWRVSRDGAVATIEMDVDENGGLFDGYPLKLNSYDLGVDIELADIVRRMRFEHPQVKAVILKSGKPQVFCAGANIRMLSGASHSHKVNFCKFTNETRNTLEAAGADSGQHYICAIRGACAGGGYELALCCEYIMLTDDSSSAVSLPEVPLLAVLPGTGGLTRVTDKRKVRRDLADVFCSTEEGIKGKRAQDWRLVDELVPNSRFDEIVQERAQEFAAQSKRAAADKGVTLTPLERKIHDNGDIDYRYVTVRIDRELSTATVTLTAPDTPAPADPQALKKLGADAWLIDAARALDDAVLHLRFNETDIGMVIFKCAGEPEILQSHEALLLGNLDHWLCNEIRHEWKRLFKRIDLTSRSLTALVEPGSCFTGMFAEILFACDRSYMADGQFEGDNRPPASVTLSAANFGLLPMSNGLSRLETRLLGDSELLQQCRKAQGKPLDAQQAERLGLVTFIFDDIDWEDEIRIFLEERASFSPDALTGMEANLRFAGPETMETRIFGRLTAWQNWIFNRPNASGDDGALKRYGTGQRGAFDRRRV